MLFIGGISKNPNLASLKKVSNYLNVPIEELLDEKQEV